MQHQNANNDGDADDSGSGSQQALLSLIAAVVAAAATMIHAHQLCCWPIFKLKIYSTVLGQMKLHIQKNLKIPHHTVE